ncbi:MAG: hypothetical protein RMK67_02295 [Chloroflexota bacterium]|nr:hypothetical protein [Chloroflexota bacterium]
MRRWVLFFLLGGIPGLLLALLLGAAPMPPILRRLLLVGGAGLLGSLFLGAVAGNLGLRATGPEDPTAAFAAAGAVAVAGAVVTLAVVAAMAVRAARRPTQAAPAAPTAPTAPTALATTGSEGAQGGPASAVAIHGAAPEEAARLEEALRPVAAVMGLPLVVVITPGRPRGWQLERGVLLQVPRPQERLLLAALEDALLGGGSPGAPRRERPSRRAPEAGGAAAPRRPRPEDIAAAVGGAAPEGNERMNGGV